MSLTGVVQHPVMTDGSAARLVNLCRALGAISTGGPLSTAELVLLADASSISSASSDSTASAIREGGDPLGDLLVGSRSQAERRSIGQFLTPWPIVRHMVRRAIRPETRIAVDAGCGSGRFAIEVARSRPDMEIHAVDLDPLASLVTRANAAALGLENITVTNTSFLTWQLPASSDQVAYLSNPPYVRHHEIPQEVKRWGADTARALGREASSLSGLHAYFLLATAQKARTGDRGCFITSAEWLDVGYGALMRSLLTDGLGLELLELLDSSHRAFEDAMTTSVVTTFEHGTSQEAVGRIVRHTDDLGIHAGAGRAIDRSELEASDTWSRLLRSDAPPDPGHVPLGTYARVSRGLVTGANGFFVMTREEARERELESWVEPVISDAREVQAASRNGEFALDRLRVLLDAPALLPTGSEAAALARYLSLGAEDGRHTGYIASRRRPWWSLARLPRPPIVATYMSRTGPVFALNPKRLPILNVAHGIYPYEPMSNEALTEFVEVLNHGAGGFIGRGRTYHGGLEKFEPREMERLLIPPMPSAVV